MPELTLLEREKLFEDRLAQSRLAPSEKNRERLRWAEIQRSERDRRVQAIVTRDRQAMQKAPILSKIQPIAAGALNLIDAAMLGYAPQIAGALGGPQARENLELGIEASQQENPVASLVGRVGGSFTGPAGLLAKGAGAAARIGTGAGRLAKAAGGAGFGVRAAAQTGLNLTTGAGAMTGVMLAESRKDDATLGARLHDIATAVSSPTNLALSATFGLAGAKFQRPVAMDKANLVAKFQRQTGQRLPNDILTNSKEWQLFLDAMQHMPGMADDVEKFRNNVTRGMRQVADDMARSRRLLPSGTKSGLQAREAVRFEAAQGVRRMVGFGPREPGSITKARRGAEGAALQSEGLNRLSDTATRELRDGLAAIRKLNRAREDTQGMDEVVRKVMKVTRTRMRGRLRPQNPTLEELEALRKLTAERAWASNLMGPMDPRFSDMSRRQASMFYAVLDRAMESAGPRYSKALRSGERLRRFEEALPKVVDEVDDEAMRALYTGKGSMRRIQALRENGSPQDVQSAAGWYFHRFVEKTANPETALFNETTMNRLWAQEGGAFNSQKFDTVLPGLRQELRDYAAISTALKKGLFAPTGSQTAQRSTRQLAAGSLPAAVVGVVTWVLGNPGSAIPSILGTIGVAQVLRRSVRSLVAGQAGSKLNRVLLEGPQGISRAAVAAQQSARGLNPQTPSLPISGGTTP